MERAQWNSEVDVLVFGAGCGGMSAALASSILGMSALVCEKSDLVGGTTSTSAGTVWIPLSREALAKGLDSRENVQRYLAALIPDADRSAALRAYLDHGARMLEFFAQHSAVQFTLVPKHPDYQMTLPGATDGGRALIPPVFDGRLLGADFDRVRPPIREFMVLGGMMLGKLDIAPLLQPLASAANFRHALGLLVRHGLDRLRYKRGTRLVMGNALVGRLLYSLLQRQVPIRYRTGLHELIKVDGRVVGAAIATPAGIEHVRARRGVILACGGFGGNASMRNRYFPAPTAIETVGFEGNTADAMAIAQQAGAVIDTDHLTPTFWVPASQMRRDDGTVARYPHIILDRAKPGLIAIDGTGQRFTNEAQSYHDFVLAMYANQSRANSVPAYLICDAAFIRDYGIGLVHPGTRNLRTFIDNGYLKSGSTIAALAAAIGVDEAALSATIARYNEHAARGEDPQFGRGSNELNRFNGDPMHAPNPCVRPIGSGPYYAVAVYPSDLSTSVGLKADEHARLLDAQGSPIAGLFSCGADMSSVMRGAYPGPGTTLGPAMTFAYIAAHFMAGERDATERAHSAEVSLSPTMPATINATLNSRAGLADSPKRKIPRITVPTAPMPTHTA